MRQKSRQKIRWRKNQNGERRFAEQNLLSPGIRGNKTNDRLSTVVKKVQSQVMPGSLEIF